MSFLMVRNLATAACEARRCAQETAERGVDQVAVAAEYDHGDPQDREGDQWSVVLVVPLVRYHFGPSTERGNEVHDDTPSAAEESFRLGERRRRDPVIRAFSRERLGRLSMRRSVTPCRPALVNQDRPRRTRRDLKSRTPSTGLGHPSASHQRRRRSKNSRSSAALSPASTPPTVSTR
jgi:hypothetical protein